MSHVVSSETGMLIQLLMRLVDFDDGIMVHVCQRGLPESEDTLEPVRKAFDDVPQYTQPQENQFRELLRLSLTGVVNTSMDSRQFESMAAAYVSLIHYCDSTIDRKFRAFIWCQQQGYRNTVEIREV